MSQQTVDLVRGAFEAYARGDLDAAYSYLHPEIEFHTYSESPEAGVYRGREAVRKYNEGLFGQFESFRAEIEEVVDTGDHVVVVSTQYAVPRGGKQEIDVHMTEVWTIRDDLLAERHSYSTRDAAFEAVGLRE